MKWLQTGLPLIWVTSSVYCPSLYPSWAGPDAHVESSNELACQAVPWSDPSSLYFQIEPALISDTVFVAPPPDPWLLASVHAPVRGLYSAGRPFTSTDLVSEAF